MLVCNVSLRPTRAGIAAALAEAGAAADVVAVGTVFASLVDDPASASDSVNAYLGSILLEAASASDAVGVAGSILTGAVVEATSAADTVTPAAGVYAASVVEAATAAAAEDATVAGAVTARSAMLPGVFVNSDTLREANANGIMVNI